MFSQDWLYIQNAGEIHRRGEITKYSRSPLYEPKYLFDDFAVSCFVHFIILHFVTLILCILAFSAF